MKMQNKRKLYLIISIVSFFIVLIALLAIGVLLFSYKQASDDYYQLAQESRKEATAAQAVVTEDTTVPIGEAAEETLPPVPLVEIPINFDYLKEQNEDIIGWIMVDGTVIDYPILYDTSYNFYYLKHNYNGTATGYGSIVVLGDNADDFTDFNTVIYGHNMVDGKMFTQLHKFRKDRSFFDEHGQIVIYTADRKLTYQVFAAYRTDNLNIIVNNDFSTEELREAYIERIYAHTDSAFFKPEYPVTASDRIITLSTCIGNPDYRYVVQGVLVSDELGEFAQAQTTDEDTSGS